MRVRLFDCLGGPGSGRLAGWRRLSADQRGTTAVEFGMVATPFFMMLFGIISVGFYFFTTFTLENAIESSARLIRTGQMQSITSSGSPAAYSYPSAVAGCSTTVSATALKDCFKQQVCNHLPTYQNCLTNVRVIVSSYSGFAGASSGATNAGHTATSPCLSGGTLVADGTTDYTPGTASQVVLVTACYKWTLAGHIPFLKLGGMSDGSALIQASTVFMTEPYN